MEKSVPDATPDQLALDDEPESAAAAASYALPGDESLVEPEAPLTPDQTTLFDLDTLTVVLPDEAIRAQYAAAGETAETRKLVYDTTTIRQIVLYYDAAEYRDVLDMLEACMRATGTTTHTQALTRLLREHYTCAP